MIAAAGATGIAAMLPSAAAGRKGESSVKADLTGGLDAARDYLFAEAPLDPQSA
ncbi:hypothetical protein KRR38_01825 [Novosphingobium sp. G106]|uniref:hypothetical protein n=1 Tax=Novosphingobium sp. G106 TaxID=2849500 RepID=UPI001C2CE1AA|nr:hypothetical protein [Novosphingobium sp. G106]MBV1686441.1 hypothetical protein [Novosphingobium sp. G106]